MLTHDRLILAEQVEQTAAQLYRLLATKFPPSGEASRVFSTLAQEEDQHALRVGMLRSRYSQRPRDFDGFLLDVELLRGLLQEGQTLATLFSPEAFSLTVQEAKRFMIELERHFASAHAQAMLGASNEDLRLFFEALAEQDRMHVQILEDLVL